MHTRAEHAVPPLMPIPVSATVCHAMRFPHRALAVRGPRRPLSSPRVLHSEVLSTGMHSNLFVTLPAAIDAHRPCLQVDRLPRQGTCLGDA
jgi:hypothetical protein